MAKEKNQNSYIIPKRYVYIFWGVSYAFCTLVLFYLSKRYYKPIEICDETNSVLDIIWDELGNSITVASGLLCLLMNFISQREKQIELIIPGISEPPARTLRATVPENERHIFR